MDCSKPILLQPWSRNPNISVKTLADEKQDEVQACDVSKLKDEELKTCQSYTLWSQILAGADGVVLATANIVNSTLKKTKPKLATDIYDSFGAIYTAIAGVNNEFLQAIIDINQGKSFEIIDSPSSTPSWTPPDQSGSNASSVIEGVWNALKPVLEIVLKKFPDGSKWKVVFAGLIKNGDEALKKLIPLLQEAFG